MSVVFLVLSSIPRLVHSADQGSLTSTETEQLEESLTVILKKMKSATRTLETSENTQESKVLVEFIRECAECLASLKKLSKA